MRVAGFRIIVHMCCRCVCNIDGLSLGNIDIVGASCSRSTVDDKVCFCGAEPVDTSGSDHRVLQRRCGEPYTSYRLNRLRNGFQLLSEPASTVLHFNFNKKEVARYFMLCRNISLFV